MKRSVKLTLTGSVQSLFFRLYIKEHADGNNVKGFLRMLENGKMEIFLEGDNPDVENMIAICSRGPQHATIRNVEQKDEYFQDLKEFKIIKF